MLKHKYSLNRNKFISRAVSAFGLFLLTFIVSSAAHAVQVSNVTDIADNIVTSSEQLPGLITGISYLLALLLGVLGVLKLKDHVENPTQTPLRTPIIRFIIGGALLALPILYETMLSAFNGGVIDVFNPDEDGTIGQFLSGALGGFSGALGIGTPDINGIMSRIIEGLQGVPALVSAVSYILALVLGVSGLLKIKDHVENPDQTPMREGVTRILVGGALFALPAIFNAMMTLIDGDAGIGFWGQIQSILGTGGWFFSAYGGGCNPTSGAVGGVIGQVVIHSGAAPAFLSAMSYIFGIIMGVWGILKIRDHVLNPQQTQVWEGFSRFIAGGAFFALPVTVEAIRATVTPASLNVVSAVNAAIGFTGRYNETAVCTAADPGLDVMLSCMMSDIIGPVHSVLNFFTFVAGMVFIMIGISRLVKSAQDGARGPGGVGTFMTFVAGGALISFNEFISAFTGSFFTNPLNLTFAKLTYVDGMTPAEQGHAHTVISAILKFMIIIGLISFVRGIFIVRNVAEGNGQASLMAGVTHMVGGSLAVNLGPLLQVVQSTLGITNYGIGFTLT